jgi:hypothetical protein
MTSNNLTRSQYEELVNLSNETTIEMQNMILCDAVEDAREYDEVMKWHMIQMYEDDYMISHSSARIAAACACEGFDVIDEFLDIDGEAIFEFDFNKMVEDASSASFHTIRLMNHDMYELMLLTAPSTFVQSTGNIFRLGRMDIAEPWWTRKHPLLADKNGRYSFKSVYRVTRETFEWVIENVKNCAKYAGADKGIPVEYQVASVLWRFGRAHFAYIDAERVLGISAGSYNRFTNRFIDAMTSISGRVIKHPFNDPAKQRANAQAFLDLGWITSTS